MTRTPPIKTTPSRKMKLAKSAGVKLRKSAGVTLSQPAARANRQDEAMAEALQILDRIESELPAIEQRTERLMHHYGLLHGEGKLTATAEVQKPQP